MYRQAHAWHPVLVQWCECQSISKRVCGCSGGVYINKTVHPESQCVLSQPGCCTIGLVPWCLYDGNSNRPQQAFSRSRLVSFACENRDLQLKLSARRIHLSAFDCQLGRTFVGRSMELQKVLICFLLVLLTGEFVSITS